MDTLKLTYFDFSGGRAEPARLALYIGGIPFEDIRIAPGDYPEVRKTTPLNRVPTLHIDGLQVTQSDTITRFVGKLSGPRPGPDRGAKAQNLHGPDRRDSSYRAVLRDAWRVEV